MKRIFRINATTVLIAALSLTTTSCGTMRSADLNTTRYTLNPVQAENTSAVRHHAGRYGTLLVQAIEANPAVASAKMAYVRAPEEIAYFAKNKWAAPPADLLTVVIAQGLRNGGYYRGVVTAPFAGKPDLMLNMQLLHFEQIFLSTPSYFYLQLSAQCLNTQTHQLVRSATFSAKVTAHEDNPAGGARAANRAVGQVLQRLTYFCQ